MTQPLVSVLIPCRNAERTVAETLESVLCQTWGCVEAIVVENGSTDDTASVLESFSQRGVHVIRHEKSGAGAARNRAYNECSGEYLVFLDADDVLHREKISHQVRLLEDNPGCVSCCRWGRFVEQPDDAVFREYPVWRDMEPVDWLTTSWLGGGMMFPGTWMIPRAEAESAGPWNESLSLNDDGEYFTRVVLASAGVRFHSDAIVYYRAGDGTNLSAAMDRAALESGFRVCELATNRLLEAERSDRTLKASATMFQRFAYDCFSNAPDLAKQAELCAQRLGGSDLKAPGGTLFKAIAAVAGWKVAKRLQSLRRNAGGSS